MEKFKEFPGINFNFSQYIRDNVEEALSGVKGANSVKIVGTDLNELEELGQRVSNILKTVPGIENVGMFHVVGQPNLQIEIDRSLCARHGVNVADVEKVVQVAIGGEAFSQMVEREKLFDIVLRLPPELRNDPEMIGRILVDVPGTSDDSPGYRIPLSQLTQIKAHNPGASYIYRENNRRYLPIKFSVRDRDLASAIAEAKRKVDDPKTGVELPEGYEIKWSGEFEQMEQANDRLMWIIPLSLGLIMMLLYSMFSSVKDCLLVMVNVLEAAMGGVFALYLTGTHFSISGAVGFVSVFGVAVQDGVLLVTYCNQMRARGYSVWETCLRGPELRVRPVVMTSLDRCPGALSRRDRHLDRVAGAEAAGHRRGRSDALHAVPDPVHDADSLQLFPGSAGLGRRGGRAPRRRDQLQPPLPPRFPGRGLDGERSSPSCFLNRGCFGWAERDARSRRRREKWAADPRDAVRMAGLIQTDEVSVGRAGRELGIVSSA